MSKIAKLDISNVLGVHSLLSHAHVGLQLHPPAWRTPLPSIQLRHYYLFTFKSTLQHCHHHSSPPTENISISLSLSPPFSWAVAMVNPLLYVLAAISTITTCTASSLTLTIPSSNILPNPQVLPATTHATLTTLPAPPHAAQNAKHILSAPLTSSGTFVFPTVQGTSAKESYLLDIRSREYVFAPYRVDVAADGRILGIWETFRGNQWDNRGAEKYTAPVGGSSHQQAGNEVMVEAKVLARRGFYEERPRCKCLHFNDIRTGVRDPGNHCMRLNWPGQFPLSVCLRTPCFYWASSRWQPPSACPSFLRTVRT
jgi:hypothetical protein